MLGKRWALGTALTLLATASIAITGGPPAGAVTAQQGTVTVTPSQNLASPETVHVSWSGIPNSSNNFWYLFECARSFPSNEFQAPQECNFQTVSSSPQDTSVGKGFLGQGGFQCPQPGTDSCYVAVMAGG